MLIKVVFPLFDALTFVYLY
jgi:peroxidase